jgi:hypothetical protein
VQLSEAELLPTARWLSARQRGHEVPLDGFAAPRAALIQLSAELALVVQRKGVDPRFWERLYEQAQWADQSLAEEDDFRRLRENVRLFLQMASGNTRRPLERLKPRRPVPNTLAGMVAEWRVRLLEAAT